MRCGAVRFGRIGSPDLNLVRHLTMLFVPLGGIDILNFSWFLSYGLPLSVFFCLFVPFVRRASLSKSGRSTTVSKNARGAPKATVKSRFPEAKHRPEEMDATGEGSSSPSLVRSQACDHSQLCAQVEAASAFVSASYRTAREKALDLYRGTMTSLGCVADAVRPRWHERCHLPEVLKRVKSRRFPLLLALLLSVAVTLSWNWMLARSHSKSWEDTEEWQVSVGCLSRRGLRLH